MSPTEPPAAFPLQLLSGRFAVCRLSAQAPVPPWALRPNARFVCITRTEDELSIVCPESDVPPPVRVAERGYRAFKLQGPVPFTTTGVVSGLTGPLAAAGISVFVVSTYDTDYLLVKEASLAAAQATLTAAGFVFR